MIKVVDHLALLFNTISTFEKKIRVDAAVMKNKSESAKMKTGSRKTHITSRKKTLVVLFSECCLQ